MSELLSHRIAIRKLARRQKSHSLLSISVDRKLTRSYGRKRAEFFKLYPLMRDVYEGVKPMPENGFSRTYRGLAKGIRRRLTKEETKYKLRELHDKLMPLLRQFDRKPQSARIIRRAIPLFADMIELCANDHDIFLERKRLPRPGWIRFTKSRKEDARLQKLKRDDPETYEQIKRERELYEKLDEEIVDTINKAGLKPTKKKIRNRLVNIGVDPVTGEEIVYDIDGDVLPIDEYVEKLDRKREQMKKLKRIHPDKRFLEDLRSIPEEVVDEYRDMSEVEYTALTDDEKEQNQGTRIYPVQEIQGEKVIVKGEFKGYRLADVVNRTGRLIRGISYDVDPKTGHSYPVETRDDEGDFDVQYKGDRRKSHDPYVTVCPDTGDLFLKVASGQDWVDMRRNVRAVTKVSPDAEYVEGTRNSTFRFKPEEFDAMRDACKTMNMSEAAMDKVREHYEEAARVERVRDDEISSNYGIDSIGGFKDFEDDRDLYRKQKEALAWIEGRGGNGLLGLDTGTGKTITAVAYIQNMISKDMLGPNDRVLYVCPTKLKGNLKGDAREWVEDFDGFWEHVDVMTYYWLSRAGNPNFLGHYPHLEGYGDDIMDYYKAVIFDEAHEVKNVTTNKGKIANKEHPRKVMMTASPMEREPSELRKLVGMANNEDMSSKEGRKSRRDFEKRYCEKLGSRVVGLKDDPDVTRRAKEWAKQNMYYGHKQDVEEVDLPQMRRYNENVSMPPALEEKYREVAGEISSLIERLNRLYKEFDADAADPEVTGALPKLKGKLKKLKELSDMPHKEFPWMSNPKVDRAEELIKEKIETSVRSLLWSSSPEMAEYTAKTLSEKMPGTYHAEGQSDHIRVWKSGEVATLPNGKKMKYTKRRYKDDDGEWTDKDLWAKHIMDTKIKNNPWIMSCTLTSSFSTGQNLQPFTQVIHMDRASNAEEFSQRSARAYRSGQQESVQEHTIDVVYDAEKDFEEQETIDSIIRAVREMEEDMFQELVVDSQSVEIGKKYFDMDQVPASFFKSKKKSLELLMSPYLEEYRDEYPSDTNPKANED